MESPDNFFMQQALREAQKAFEAGEVPVGALLVFEGRVIAKGHNQVELLQDATAHAEMLTLTMGASHLQNWRLLHTTLYCTIEPCAMCAGAMFLSRIQRIVFGAADLRHGACGSFFDLFSLPHPTHRIEVTRGVMEQEASSLLRQFFQKRREENRTNEGKNSTND